MDVSSLSEAVSHYDALQRSHPVISNVITGTGVFTLCDIISQYIENKTVNWRKVGFTAKLAPLYGLGLYGLMESGNAVGHLIDSNQAVSEALGPDGKALAMSELGPNFWGNLQNAFFFYNNSIGKRSQYKASLGDIVKEYTHIFDGPKSAWQNFKQKLSENIPRNEYINAVLGSVIGWGVIQYFNYKYVPDHLQTPVALACVIPWVTALSLWSLRGKTRTGDRISGNADITPQ